MSRDSLGPRCAHVALQKLHRQIGHVAVFAYPVNNHDVWMLTCRPQVLPASRSPFSNIRGKRALLDACRQCRASLFTDRAISYRVDKGFDHFAVALSIGVQKMVRSDVGAAGVLFTLDPRAAFPTSY
jgi:hypothetical protein